MKLLEMKVNNFRGIGPVPAKLCFLDSDIIFLLGKNNSGKSALLAAYEYLVKPKLKALLSDFHGFNASNPIKIEATFIKEVGDEEEFESKGFNKWVDENDQIRFQRIWKEVDTEGQKSTFDPSTNDFTENGFGGLEQHFTKHAPTVVRIPAMPTPDELSKWVSNIVKQTILKKLSDEEQAAYDDITTKISAFQNQLVSSTKLTDMTKAANDSFQKVFPELQLLISAAEGETFDLRKALEKEFSITVKDSRYEDINQDFSTQGHGVVRQAMFNFLGLVKETFGKTDSKAKRKEFIILFEEPEIYLHPKGVFLLRDALYDLCKNSPFQLLCASHSPMLIDLSRPHTSLVRIRLDSNKQVMIHQAGDDLFNRDEDMKNQVQMNNRFNPHLCEIFFADNVVLVEGDTEAIVLRQLFSELDNKSNIFVLNTGSKNNIPFYQEILTHFLIEQHVIHDVDSRYLYDDNGDRSTKKDGTPKANSAWSLNSTIWKNIQKANKQKSGLAHRYCHVKDFESAHKYKYNTEKGKPLSAFEFSKIMSRDNSMPIYKFARQIQGSTDHDCEFTQEDIEKLVPDDI
jgi:putative ATP-dependent endonuclease of OLD family